jgi:DNA-binding LacI/PurR family transcriptional regulator
VEKTNSPDGAGIPSKAGSASIREVARLASVSPATVSRVLNGSPSVREGARQRVLAAIASVDYRPNRLARNLRRQQAEMIGVVVSDIENPHFSETVRVIEDEAYRAGYRVVLCNSDETPDKQLAYLKMLADERAGGVILSPADRRGSGVDALLSLNIPVVAFDRMLSDDRIDSVVVVNVAGVRRATEHLIWLGLERIAFVGGRPDTETGAGRLEGYTAAMRDAGLVPFSISGGFRREVAEEEVARLVATPRRPTALLVANNQMTLGTLRALRRSGLGVPGDVAVVGVDDAARAEVVDPPLTAVAQPVREMAQTAMTLLRERIEGRYDGAARRVVLPLELRVRASCGMSTSDKRGEGH